MPVPPAPIAVEPVCCFLERTVEMDQIEDELERTVVVTILGSRPAVDLADVASLLYREF